MFFLKAKMLLGESFCILLKSKNHILNILLRFLIYLSSLLHFLFLNTLLCVHMSRTTNAKTI